jgi:hypothetical protein
VHAGFRLDHIQHVADTPPQPAGVLRFGSYLLF